MRKAFIEFLAAEGTIPPTLVANLDDLLRRAPEPIGAIAFSYGMISGADVDVINGHLTATGADPREIGSWSRALGRGPDDFPAITATKSMIGHALGAAGGIECVASVLMVSGGFVHASLNCEDVHPEIEPFAASIAHETREFAELRTLVKAGFGFGDVNACAVFQKFPQTPSKE